MINRTLTISILGLSLFGATACTPKNPVAWWQSINEKAKHINTLEARYEALERAHQQLKREFFELEHENAELKAKRESHEVADLSLKATGSLTGRTLASIHYQVPKGLKPEQVLALAYEHFNEQRFAEAAVSFEKLVEQPESAALIDGGALYSAGVAWFKVGNLHKAKDHLEQARAAATGDQREKIQKKVDLWLRVVDRKLASAAVKPKGH